MASMTKDREGFRTLFAQIPAAAWAALEADAEARGESIAKTVTRVLYRHYRLDPTTIPKPKKAGRKPKK